MITAALDTFRRGAPRRREDGVLPAAFVLEPDMALACSVVAAWRPAALLTARFGAHTPTSEPLLRDALRDAIGRRGARTVVLCGEADVPPSRGASEGLLAACLAWTEALPTLSSDAVAVEALWFDVAEGDLHRWVPGAGFVLLSDLGLLRFGDEIRERAP